MRAKPARALAVLGYPDIYAPRRQPTRPAHGKPIGCEAMDDVLHPRCRSQHRDRHERAAAPARRPRVADGRARRRHACRGARDAVELTARRLSPQAARIIDDPQQRALLADLREQALGVDAFEPGKPDNYEGWEDSSSAAGAARRVPARAPRAVRAVRPARLALRPLRPGLRPHPDRLRPRLAGGRRALPARSLPTRPGWSSRTAARCRASTAMASRAPICTRSCSAPSWSRRSTSSRRSGIRTARSIPARWSSPDPRTRTCGWSITTRRPEPDRAVAR